MKLLLITQKVDRSDALLGFFHEWIIAFAKRWKEVHVICLYKGEYDLPDNVFVYSLGKEHGTGKVVQLLLFYKYLGVTVLQKKVTTVFVHMSEVYMALLLPAIPYLKFRNVKVLWWKTHGTLSSLSKKIYKHATHIVTASERSFPIETSKRVVLGHGIDTDVFKINSVLEKKYDIVAVGRITAVKNYDALIDAVSRTTKEQKPRTALVGLTDETKQSDYYKKLTQQIAEHDLADIITIKRSKRPDQMPELYNNSLIIVNTSKTNSIDKVVLEAMACGVIPVTTNEAYKKMLEPFGLWTNHENIDELSIIIDRVLSLSADKLEALQKEMRNIVVEKHNLTQLIEKIYELS